LPKTWHIHPIFHVNKLHPVEIDEFPKQKINAPPPPQIVDDKLKYEVEYIEDSRSYQGKLQYLVK
jgi:hypothetical protein